MFLRRSGRSSQKPGSSRAGLRLGNNALRDSRGFGSRFGAREYYRGFGVQTARKTRQKTREKDGICERNPAAFGSPFIGAEPSHVRGAYALDRHGLRIGSTRVQMSSCLGVRGAYTSTRGVLRIGQLTPLRIISEVLIKNKY